jgi:hypothetical protein
LTKHKKPKYPFKELKSAAGGSETAPALEDTPEFLEYQDSMDQYRIDQSRLMREFEYNYGIVGWKDPEEEKWHKEPPEDWTVPEGLRRYGVETSKDPTEFRAQYINYELILTDADRVLVESAIGVGPVSKEDIEAALVPFVSPESTESSGSPSKISQKAKTEK